MNLRTGKHNKRPIKGHKKPLTVRKKDFFTESALGDGNCAFNAFALGLFTPEVIAQIENNLKTSGQNPNEVFKPFINDVFNAATKGGIQITKDWESVKNLLLKLRQGSQREKEVFQRALAPILRNASIALSKNSAHLELTKEPMMSAFRDYVDHKLGFGFRGGEDDDVYNQHDFIQQKFEEFSKVLDKAILESKFDIGRYTNLKTSENLDEEAEAELAILESAFCALVEKIQNTVLWSWWSKDGGFNQFLDAMMDQRSKGENNKWAGDYELYPLAKYFGVNLDVEKRGSPYHILINHGSFPRNKLSEDQIVDLVDRGIIDRPRPQDKEIQFLRIDVEELAIRLSAFPAEEQKQLELFFLTYEDQHNPVSLKGALVPDDWSDTLLQQLYVRDMIRPIQGGRNYVFNLNLVDTKKRMFEVQNPDSILDIWREYARSNPTVTLENNDATHWNNKRSGEVVVRKSATEHVSKHKDKLPKRSKDKEDNIDRPSENFKKLENKLLSLLDKNDESVRFVEKNRNGLFREAQEEAKKLKTSTLQGKKEQKEALKSGKFVQYFFDDKEPIIISKETQIKLDTEYAKKLQQEHFAPRRKR